MLAFILLTVKPNTEEKTYEKLKKFPEVRDAHILFGSWDLLLKVEVKDAASLNEFMLEKVRKIDAVTLSATMIVAK